MRQVADAGTIAARRILSRLYDEEQSAGRAAAAAVIGRVSCV
jgi:hypothetical protein